MQRSCLPLAALLLGASTAVADAQERAPTAPVLKELALQADALGPLVESDAARALLAAVADFASDGVTRKPGAR